MLWILFLLILMGQCSLFECHLYEYHFIEEKKTWEEAQKYCRAHYTDLAKVFDMTDMKRLHDKNKGEAWIGLYNQTNVTRKWHWSLPGVEFNENETNWDQDEPNNIKVPENCVWMEDHKWKDVPCTDDEYPRHNFICYDAKQLNETFHWIEDKMDWPRAQNYCREYHTDLVSGLRQLEDIKFMHLQQKSDSVWIGLFTDSWKWSDGSNFSYRNWDLNSFKDEADKKCAMTVSNGKWSSDDCNKTKSFFCYDDNLILINETMKWEEALNYCRKNYRDLVSISNSHQQKWVQEKAKMAASNVWLGLRYTCTMDLWFWVNDKLVCYENWAPENKTDGCYMAVAMDKEGKWFKMSDNDNLNFVCALK